MLAWMYQKVFPEENWKISLRLQNFKIFEIFDHTILKKDIFPSKNHLAFLTIERYDIELTNIKISDKNFVPLGGAQAPEGESFLLLFWNVADFCMKW